MDIYKIEDNKDNYIYHLFKDQFSICNISPGLLFEPKEHDLEVYRLELQNHTKGTMINFSIDCRTKCEMYEIYNYFINSGYHSLGKVKISDPFEDEEDERFIFNEIRRIWFKKEDIISGLVAKPMSIEYSAKENLFRTPYHVKVDIPFTLRGLRDFYNELYELQEIGYAFIWILKENSLGGVDYIIK